MTYEEITRGITEYILSLPDRSTLTMGDAVNQVCPNALNGVLDFLNYTHLDGIIDAVEKTGVVLDYTAHDGLIEGAPFNMDFIVRKKRLQKVQIISDLLCLRCPEDGDPVEQHLTISASGRIWFTEYLFRGIVRDKYPVGRKIQFSIGKAKAAELLSLIADFIESKPRLMYTKDIGMWNLTAAYPDGTESRLRGSLDGGIAVDDIDLTEIIRESIPIDGLAVFENIGFEDD